MNKHYTQIVLPVPTNFISNKVTNILETEGIIFSLHIILCNEEDNDHEETREEEPKIKHNISTL